MPPRSMTASRSMRGFLLAVAAIIMVAGNLLSVSAAALTSGSLLLSDPRTSQASVSYTFAGTGFTTGTGIGCVQLDLGSSSDGTGAIAGLDTSASTLVSSTLITAANWSVDNTGSGSHQLRITHNTATQTPAASGNVVWGGITNGSTESVTYYGVLNTYTGTNCSTGPTDSITIAFLYRDGELVTLTLGPQLTFTCNSVGTGVSVNSSPNTTVTSGPTGIDFGTITASANGLSAHRLDVSTNAAGGYVVYIRHSSDLENLSGDTITPHTGTNASPTAFPSAGSEAWGYTTEDSSLSGGTPDRFTSGGGNKWAGFSTNNNEVVFNNSAPVGTEQTQVAHQVGISSSTEAGTYQTTIIYTLLATF